LTKIVISHFPVSAPRLNNKTDGFHPNTICRSYGAGGVNLFVFCEKYNMAGPGTIIFRSYGAPDSGIYASLRQAEIMVQELYAERHSVK